MIGRTNVGGNGRPFAVIGVTYPKGSIVTCSNGKQTIKAKDTSGEAMLIVPSTGDWTVTSIQGNQSANKVMSITKAEQVNTIIMAYANLYKNGTFASNFDRVELTKNATITYLDNSIKVVSNSSSTSYGLIVFKKVNLIGFKLINVTFSAASSYGDGGTIAVVNDISSWSPSSTSTGTLAYKYDTVQTTSSRTITLDVEALNGIYDIAVGFSTQNSSWYNSRTMNYASIVLS